MGMIQKGVNQIIAGLGAAAVAGEARKTRESGEADRLTSTGYELANEGQELKNASGGISPEASGNEAFKDAYVGSEGALTEAATDVENAKANLEMFHESDKPTHQQLQEQYAKEHSREHGKFRKKADVQAEAKDYADNELYKRDQERIRLENDVLESQKALKSLEEQYKQISNQRLLFQKRLESFNKKRDKLLKKGYDIPSVKETK